MSLAPLSPRCDPALRCGWMVGRCPISPIRLQAAAWAMTWGEMRRQDRVCLGPAGDVRYTTQKFDRRVDFIGPRRPATTSIKGGPRVVGPLSRGSGAGGGMYVWPDSEAAAVLSKRKRREMAKAERLTVRCRIECVVGGTRTQNRPGSGTIASFWCPSPRRKRWGRVSCRKGGRRSQGASSAKLFNASKLRRTFRHSTS